MSTVKSGLVPVDKDVEKFEITTQSILTFLQKKVTTITSRMRDKGIDIDDIKVMMVNSKLGKNYVSFTLLLPESVLENARKSKNINPIFASDGDKNGNLFIVQPIYQLILNYMYTKNDRNAMRYAQWRKATGITKSRNVDLLINYSRPRYFYGEDNERYIMVMLDPLRVVHDMLVDPNDNYKFSVWFTKNHEIEGGSFCFEVLRDKNKKKNNNDASKDIQKRLARMIVNN